MSGTPASSSRVGRPRRRKNGPGPVFPCIVLPNHSFFWRCSMRTQLRSLWAFGAFAVIFCVVVSVSQLAGQGQAARGRGNTPVERGKYFVDITGCHDCHSPKKDAQGHIDETRILSGRPSTTAVPSTTAGEIHTSLDLTAWTGPWGTTYASNLTPDPKTGLVSRKYTETTFISMFRTG